MTGVWEFKKVWPLLMLLFQNELYITFKFNLGMLASRFKIHSKHLGLKFLRDSSLQLSGMWKRKDYTYSRIIIAQRVLETILCKSKKNKEVDLQVATCNWSQATSSDTCRLACLEWYGRIQLYVNKVYESTPLHSFSIQTVEMA